MRQNFIGCFYLLFPLADLNIGLSRTSNKLFLILDLNSVKLLSLLTYGSSFAFYMLSEPQKNEGKNILRIILLGTL